MQHRVQDPARDRLTDKQYEAWQLHSQGLSTRWIARHLQISRSSARDRVETARDKLERQHDQPL